MAVLNPDTTEMVTFRINPGTYPATLDTVVADTSKNCADPQKGPDMLVIEVGVAHDPAKPPQTVKTWVMIRGKGARSFDQLLRAVGLDSVADAYKNPEASKPTFDSDALIGQKVTVVTIEEEYNGDMTPKIKRFLKA